ncbi:hypothetical protein B188_17680 [Candidatus Brocadiaceae bacterium B188]|nr:hypothetical protein B188_17680 [Candidatus Brocadiaceae bacterium B188]
MTKTHVQTKFTYQDYFHTSEDARYELIKGEEFFVVTSRSECLQRISRGLEVDLNFVFS